MRTQQRINVVGDSRRHLLLSHSNNAVGDSRRHLLNTVSVGSLRLIRSFPFLLWL
jgi:hypothetical protein